MLGGILQAFNAPVNNVFKETYRVYPPSFAAKDSVEKVDKLLLPASALHRIATMEVTFPLMFKVMNPVNGKTTHCGVMEFSSEEGVCYMPMWMMKNLALVSGGYVSVLNVTLVKGNFVKLQPHKMAFTMLSNPRVVLEKTLRNFSCLSKGDTIVVSHLDQDYLLDIVDLKPSDAVSIFETDMNVEFDPPKDAPKEDERKKEQVQDISFGQSDQVDSKTTSQALKTPEKSSYFTNLKEKSTGHTLSGRKRQSTASAATTTPTQPQTPTSSNSSNSVPTSSGGKIVTQGQFQYIYDKEGRLMRRIPVRKNMDSGSKFSAFKGKGNSLK